MANDPRLAIESIAGLRPYQEDSVLAETLEDGRVLVAVADGMGGHAAGEVASALALGAVAEAVRRGRSLADAFTLANARVFAMAKEPGKQGMGTTLVAALITGDSIELANVGDSRGYLISGDGIRQVTADHSFVAEAVRRGQSEADAMAGPWKDALTRSIGTEEEVDVDVFGPLPLPDDTALVVCSDGLYKALSDSEVMRIYSESGGPRGAAQSLVSRAFENGSDDNISVAIAEFGEVRRAVLGGTRPLDFVVPAGGAANASAKQDGKVKRAPVEATLVDLEPVTAAADDEPVTLPEIPHLGSAAGARATPGAAMAKAGPPIGAIAAVVVAVVAVVAFLLFGR